RRLDDLQKRKQQLVEAFVYRRVIDQVIYDEEMNKLNDEIGLAEMAAHDAKLEGLDVGAVVVFAEHGLLNAARLWTEFSIEQKQRLQQVLFPEGITYADGKFGTTETSLIFSMLGSVQGRDESEASPAGFEPTLPA